MKLNINSLDDFRGLVCNHEATESIMVVQKATDYKDTILLHCLVLVKEEKETYIANACYSLNEVILTNFYIHDIIKKRQKITGVQLELF